MLESDEIKRLAPPYNISLRSDSRALRFFSGDFRSYSPEANERHPFGPIPSDDLQAFPVILELLHGNADFGEETDLSSRALNIPGEYAPDRECFLQGFELFSQNHAPFLGNIPSPGALFLMGANVWRKQMEDCVTPAGTEKETEMETESELPAIETEWTPFAVAHALETVISRGVWLIRRARWFCLLSESDLAFRENRASGGECRHLIIERGTITHRENVPPGFELPFPPGYDTPFPVRQRSFDLPAYDRMRVLTTELRRILLRGGDVRIRLTPRVLLSGEKVKQVLSRV